MRSISRVVKNLFHVQRHPSAGQNATPLRLVRQGLPYLFSRSGYSSPPLSLFFILNSRCNLKCQMCDVGQNYHESMFYKNLVGHNGDSRGDFPVDRFETLMEEVRPFRPFISITSTEPLLYKPIGRAIAAAKANGMSTNLTTNGVLLAQRAEELVDAGLRQVTVSIDGPPDVHDIVRGVPGTFDRALGGLLRIAELRKQRGSPFPLLCVNTVVTNVNAGHLARLMELLPLEEITQVSLALMTFCHQELADNHNAVWGQKYPASRTCVEGGCDPRQIDVSTLSGELRQVQKRYGSKVHLFFNNTETFLERYFHRPDEFMDWRPCLFPWFAAQITASGDLIGVTRCYPVKFGNIMDRPFHEAWNGPQMREFRKDLRRHRRFPACTRCEGVLY